MEKKELLVIVYEGFTETIHTHEPDKEIHRAMGDSKLLAIIRNNKIIYTKSGKYI